MLKILQLTKIAEREKQVAKHCISSGRRRQALLALRKKRLQEQMLEKSFALLQNVQEMVVLWSLVVALTLARLIA